MVEAGIGPDTETELLMLQESMTKSAFILALEDSRNGYLNETHNTQVNRTLNSLLESIKYRNLYTRKNYPISHDELEKSIDVIFFLSGRKDQDDSVLQSAVHNLIDKIPLSQYEEAVFEQYATNFPHYREF